MLIRAAAVVTLDPPLVERTDLRVRDGRIVERRPGLTPLPDEEVREAPLVLPGLVNAHTHLYSALARGMPGPRTPPRNFVEVLEKVWWRLDRALTREDVRLSALVGGIEAALGGTTLLVDHHSSPEAIPGSLTTIRDALEEIGLRSVLCYEVTDRNGPEGRDAGLQENIDFQARHQSALTRGMIGGHASFTLGDDTLDRLAQLVRESGSSLHLHVAEDTADVDDCRGRHGVGLAARLARHGLVTSRALFAHCVHLSTAEVNDVHAHGAWIAHNPRSNLNNAVGAARAEDMARAALGTDGMDEDMLAEARAAFLKLRDRGRPDAFAVALRLLVGGHRLGAALFGLPFGKLDTGAPADLVLLDYDPPTPLHAHNVAGHLLFGVDRSHVRDVMVAGRMIVRDRALTTVDVGAVREAARAAAPPLWDRMRLLPERPGRKPR